MVLRIALLLVFILISLVESPPLLGQKSIEVNLAGFQQIPPVRTAGLGFVQVQMQEDTLSVHGEFHDLMGNYRSAYIHYGEPKKTGHRMFRLTAATSNDLHSGTFNEPDNRFVLSEAQRDALVRGLLYINIASDKHPFGEIRGQIPPM